MNEVKVSKNQLEEIWDSVPVDYYQQSVRNSPLQRLWHTNKLKTLCSLIDNSPKKIIDVGCASGWFLSQVHSKFPSAQCVGVDVYKKAINWGKVQYPYLTLQTADVHKLPYKDNSFDVVISAEVLEHVVDPIKVLKEMKRVATPSGIIVIEMDSGNWLFHLVWKIWTKAKGKVWHDAHIQIYNADILKKDIQKAGLTIESTRFFNVGMAVCYKCRK